MRWASSSSRNKQKHFPIPTKTYNYFAGWALAMVVASKSSQAGGERAQSSRVLILI